jgi:hypothetical protein
MRFAQLPVIYGKHQVYLKVTVSKPMPALASSAAVFGQLDCIITERLHVLPGLRYNFDKRC